MIREYRAWERSCDATLSTNFRNCSLFSRATCRWSDRGHRYLRKLSYILLRNAGASTLSQASPASGKYPEDRKFLSISRSSSTLLTSIRNRCGATSNFFLGPYPQFSRVAEPIERWAPLNRGRRRSVPMPASATTYVVVTATPHRPAGVQPIHTAGQSPGCPRA